MPGLDMARFAPGLLMKAAASETSAKASSSYPRVPSPGHASFAAISEVGAGLRVYGASVVQIVRALFVCVLLCLAL